VRDMCNYKSRVPGATLAAEGCTAPEVDLQQLAIILHVPFTNQFCRLAHCMLRVQATKPHPPT
jgi:hypothetical protein